ncbi:MAG: 2-oxoacid:acceptor oxidoreductase subunit alpha [Dehalococcoidia bacterium]|nr:2-oxoacid:acceptor oxidoreductase subunit alpha [Dehalococcoidia bacterium]
MVEQREHFVVRFAGEGGQGVVTAAEMLAQAASQVGYYIQTFATFPSQILGGPTWTQARVATARVFSPGDELDILVAFNKEAYDTHRSEVRNGGVIVFDSAQFTPENEAASIGLPFDELAKKTGNARAANMVVLGALTRLVNWEPGFMEQFIIKRFTRNRPDDESIIKANIEALHLGRKAAGDTELQVGQLAPPQKPEGIQVLMKGNEAISVGAMAAGMDFYVGYPISPATPILLFMERNLYGPGKYVYQSSSEIESINAILGAGYAGKKAMTATAGPGFSLMAEGLGLAWMAEIPLVVVDVQRGGPATGLPTKTEQSDLNLALHPAHGDVNLPVLAPGTVEECFWAAIRAVAWAERYQGPVIILSEMMLAERSENIPKPDLSKIKIENRLIYKGNGNSGNGASNVYLRYKENELQPMSIPGGPGAYVANGSEHDEFGDTTHRPHHHVRLTERRFGKLRLLESDNFERVNPNHNIAVVPWGGSKGPAWEAYGHLEKAKVPVSWFYTMELNPLPPKMLEELKKKDLVLVPELNYQGQFASYLRSLGVKAETINQYTGLPFQVKELVHRITEKVNAASKKKVTA